MNKEQKFWLGIVLAFVAGAATGRFTAPEKGDGHRRGPRAEQSQRDHRVERGQRSRRGGEARWGERMRERIQERIKSGEGKPKSKKGEKAGKAFRNSVDDGGPWYSPGMEPADYHKWAGKWESGKGGSETCSLYEQWLLTQKTK